MKIKEINFIVYLDLNYDKTLAIIMAIIIASRILSI